MIVYRHHTYQLSIPRFVRELAGRVDRLAVRPGRDAIVDLLVDLGEAFAAVADRLMPGQDDICAPLDAWSRALRRVADAFCAAYDGDADGTRAALDGLRRDIRTLEGASPSIDEVTAGTAEGFAYYALYPEMYVEAVNRFVLARVPATLTCIGLRSIGAPLACVVAAAAARRGVACQVFTVRPRGHPFDRHLDLTKRLRARLWEAATGHIAIVDEGPGLSGSSFAAAVDEAATIGIRPAAIALFPSWRADPTALRSERGQAAFRHHDAWTSDLRDVWDAHDRTEVSAGAWRTRVYAAHEDGWPAVHPQHERRKYLSPGDDRIMRFAGLGRYGRIARDRAHALQGSGCSAAPLDLDGGFLTLEWIPGRPLRRGDRLSASQLQTVAHYLSHVRRTFATTARADTSELAEMMRVNAAEALGTAKTGGVVDALNADAGWIDEPAVAVDARMLPHEWIATSAGLVKVDALDHHADDFFPGSTDIAWDVAAAVCELALDTTSATALVERYRAASGDHTIGDRLAFYEAAYLAYRVGYTTMSAESLGATPDGARFRSLREHYRRSLAAHVCRLRSARRR